MRKVEWLVKVSVLAAFAVVLMLVEFPLPFIAPPFYELDFSEVPVLIGGFALGPLAAVVIELIKVLLNLLINGTVTGGVGEFANFLIGVSFALPASYIYKKNKCKKTAVYGLIAGGIIMVVLGAAINAYVLIPAYVKAFNMPMSALVSMGTKIYPSIDSLADLVVLCVAPFNLLKAVIVSAIAIVIYKPLSPILKKSINRK